MNKYTVLTTQMKYHILNFTHLALHDSPVILLTSTDKIFSFGKKELLEHVCIEIGLCGEQCAGVEASLENEWVRNNI